ncbi:MAG: hypothetical protein NZZ41_02825 [Candidatus Dojkabacteria bacterium]|nr:hypothetical protein [Candidatus Dojkabacteria bacterium]
MVNRFLTPVDQALRKNLQDALGEERWNDFYALLLTDIENR